jgi:hypothetical protein
MEQRPLRLGDIVDDYCPRERRITNHVIVAIVGESVRQTRCSTCDAEHVYKEARIPRRRSKDEPGGDAALGVLVSRATEGTSPTPPAPMAAAADPAKPATPPAAPAEPGRAGQPPEPMDAPAASDERADSWPAHRTLIRAQLPRVEGEQKEPRPIPEFTMHQRGRGHGYRSDFFGNGNGNGNGNGRPAHGANGGGGGGFRHSQPPQNRDQGGQPGGGQPGGGQPGAGGAGKRWRRRRGRGGRKTV